MNHPLDPGAPLPLAAAPAGPWWARPLHALLQRLLDRMQCGALAIRLPHGALLQAQGAAPGPRAALVLHRWRAVLKLLVQGDLGLAESYRDGDWSTPDLMGLLQLGLQNEAAWRGALAAAGPGAWLARLAHRAHANSRRGSRRNVAFHYDLGNDFYAQWLDETMLYSSALYARGDETLEQAQAAKLRRILQALDTPAGAEVLEIGCGWGAMAVALAQAHGARVTGLTLSAEQLRHARERADREGVAGQLDLRLQDYREVQGRFDRIVSVEMIEAVGEAYWPAYFGSLRRLLKPGGRVLLQAITIADEHFESYRRGADFIQRHIFPGGMLPSPGALQAQAVRAGFALEVELRFGPSYAATLAEWRRRFLAAWPRIEPLGFDASFKRLWEYYLCYCEAGFRSGRIDVGLYRLRPLQEAARRAST